MTNASKNRSSGRVGGPGLESSCWAASNRPSCRSGEEGGAVGFGLAEQAPAKRHGHGGRASGRHVLTILSFPAPISILSAMESIGSGASSGLIVRAPDDGDDGDADHFSSQTLAEIFRDLYVGERSGVLERQPRQHREADLLRPRDDPVRRVRRRRRRARTAAWSTREDLRRARWRRRRRNISEPKDLAQALVNRGLIGKETLSHTARYIVGARRAVRSSSGKGDGAVQRGLAPPGDLRERHPADVRGDPEGDRLDGGVRAHPRRDEGARQPLEAASSVAGPARASRALAGARLHPVAASTARAASRTFSRSCRRPRRAWPAASCTGSSSWACISYDPPVGDGAFRVTAILRDHADSVGARGTAGADDPRDLHGAARTRTRTRFWVCDRTAPRETIERAYEEAKDRFSRDRHPAPHPGATALGARRHREPVRRGVSDARAGAHGRSRGASGGRTGGEGAARAWTISSFASRWTRPKTKVAIEENAKLAESYFAQAKKFMREGDPLQRDPVREAAPSATAPRMPVSTFSSPSARRRTRTRAGSAWPSRTTSRPTPVGPVERRVPGRARPVLQAARAASSGRRNSSKKRSRSPPPTRPR